MARMTARRTPVRRGRRTVRMSKFDKQVNDLLKQAMECPGVADVMQMYQAQQPALDAYAKAQRAIATRWVMSVSTSTRHTA
jgi:hypothetical protein